MPNYRESTVEGTQWTRCNLVVIDNSLGKAPVIQFQEESVISTPSGIVSLPVQFERLTASVSADAVIEIIDPRTVQNTGVKVTEGFLYAALFSKYMKLANQRDGVPEPEPEKSPDPEPELSTAPAPEPSIEPAPDFGPAPDLTLPAAEPEPANNQPETESQP